MNHSASKFVPLTSGILAFAGLFPGTLGAQAALPATAPTTITPSQLPSANPAVPRGAADVQWDGHLLRITASGESLAEVFDQVASRAGIRMSGNPPADRIYGTYGPAPLVDVLSDLVGGLPINMLFVDRSGSVPARLTFTARVGGASPAVGTPNYAQQQPVTSPPDQAPVFQQPAFNAAAPSTVAPNPGIGGGSAQPSAAASQPADGTTNPASPNGVKTPQQIFEQLQRLRANAGAQR